MSGCKSCGARAPTMEEVSEAMRVAFVVCHCPNDGTVQEPIACFTDVTAAQIFADFEKATLDGPAALLLWAHDILCGQVEAEVIVGNYDAHDAACAKRAIEDGFGAMRLVLEQIERANAQKKVH